MSNQEKRSFFYPLETISQLTGHAVSWLTVFMVLITFTVVTLRYGFNIGSIALQESIGYFHAFIFMIGAAYTLKHDEHVRIDIFYQKMSQQRQAWVDLLGSVFLLMPMCIFIFSSSFDYVMKSWAIQEASSEAGGLPLVYLLKTSILIMPLLVMNQAFVIIIQKIQFLRQNEQAHA
ncbi:TRAP dicarboxylate transporter, DctQ subunit, unknown substrate 6 [hydrothermal vent metagenome]|uniref:Tripartite ATP-independent periplasmic transporters DctQ component domain-containing protein n=1 Tax=hydrothermal vent metagenome TaxID=652676 RepID=A0A3B1A7U0_9ZZZZ